MFVYLSLYIQYIVRLMAKIRPWRNIFQLSKYIRRLAIVESRSHSYKETNAFISESKSLPPTDGNELDLSHAKPGIEQYKVLIIYSEVNSLQTRFADYYLTHHGVSP